MSDTKPFTLYAFHRGPNPGKVAIILEELGLEWNTVILDGMTGEHKRKPFTDLNPNGRVPVLVDHLNGDFTIWESGAIIEYLLAKYDTGHKLGFAKLEDEMLARQWLHFQVSGQGPYFGQFIVFKVHFPEKLPAAIERYENETKRVLMVINNHLTDKKSTFLVNNRLSYADLSFFMWNAIIRSGDLLPGFDWRKEYPAVAAWDDAIAARPSVIKVLAMEKKIMEDYTAATTKK